MNNAAREFTSITGLINQKKHKVRKNHSGYVSFLLPKEKIRNCNHFLGDGITRFVIIIVFVIEKKIIAIIARVPFARLSYGRCFRVPVVPIVLC